MNERVAVSKMHGARNDFIVVDARESPLADPVSAARTLCDRHAGIGADGLLLLESSGVADARMRVINADGSEAEMCGNGVRCVARYLDERAPSESHRIETLAGIMDAMIVERGATYRIRVAMPAPVLQTRPLPFTDAIEVVTGNPHLVLFRTGGEIELEPFGAGLQRDPYFPDGTNVHLVRVVDGHTIDAVHYERGAGLTMACGTGAVASAAASIERGFTASPVTVRVPGGELEIEWDGGDKAFMTGPAVHVFDTVVALESTAVR